MKGEMKSYRFDISNRRENKFRSHEVSFRVHFNKHVLIDICRQFISDSVYMIFYHPK